MKRTAILLSVLFVVLFALPALASDLQLEVSLSAEESMAEQGSEWYVKPGTYRGF